MRYIAGIIFMLIGLVEFIVRAVVLLVLSVCTLTMFLCFFPNLVPYLLEPKAFQLAERCINDRYEFRP